MNIQALFDGMSAQWQKERSETQMTLGGLICRLRDMSPETLIQGITAELNSYRGYYSDLAIEPGSGTTVAKLLAVCIAAKGEVFTGYKGGEFQMGVTTPMWVADWGYCGPKLMGINDDGTLVIGEDD